MDQKDFIKEMALVESQKTGVHQAEKGEQEHFKPNKGNKGT